MQIHKPLSGTDADRARGCQKGSGEPGGCKRSIGQAAEMGEECTQTIRYTWDLQKGGA